MVRRTFGYEQPEEWAHNIKWVHLRMRVYGDSEHRTSTIICGKYGTRAGQKENKFQFSLKILHIKFVTLN